MDLVVVEGSQGVSRHGVRSWCGVVGGTWQRFPEIASENEQKLSLQGVLSARTQCMSVSVPGTCQYRLAFAFTIKVARKFSTVTLLFRLLTGRGSAPSARQTA